MDQREHKNAIKRFLAIFLGSCSSLTLLKTLSCSNRWEGRKTEERCHIECVIDLGIPQVASVKQKYRLNRISITESRLFSAFNSLFHFCKLLCSSIVLLYVLMIVKTYNGFP